MQINWGNESIIVTIEKELPESTFYWLLISILSAICWIVFLTYYNSRVLGLILTAILNRFCKYGHVKLGSFSFSVLSGKVMFRDVHFITEDFSIRVQLGLAIFRWWRPLILREIHEDLSHSETRLSVYLDTFELHVYNRSENFARLERLFGLDEMMIPKKDDDQDKNGVAGTVAATVSQTQEGRFQWRDLIPVIKLDISAGKMVFGNYQLPTTLSINFEDAHAVYTTKPSSTPFDQFMHIVKCRVDNIRVILVPSPKYSGPVDEPPRMMGGGFVVLQSHMVDIYYYHDEPGLVPYEAELVHLANGDVIARRTWPCWGTDVKCGKATDLNYGPWADRQREFLWRFFQPADYQKMEATVLPEPGKRRIFKEFDFKMSMQADATFDILYTKNKETQAIHMNTKPGSYLEFTIPWITEETGYTSKINGQLMHLDATTSLQYRSLLECETLEFVVDISYPNNWNDHQDWKCDFTACKASLFLIFYHKIFFMDLVEDWSSKARPDLFHFVPYTWRFSILMKQFELMTLANEYNWMDCCGHMPENAQIAFCGETFDLTFNLPFIDYLPPTVPIKFFIRGESIDCRLYLTETNTSRHILLSLANNTKVMDRAGTVLDMPFSTHAEKKWRRVTQKSFGWVDCWSTPIVALSIGYTYHPVPYPGTNSSFSGSQRLNTVPGGKQDYEPVSTPDAEEQLLIPLRPKKSHAHHNVGPEEFDPTSMEADLISVELEVGPSVLCLYGSLLRNFLHVKENYFGEDQKFTNFAPAPPDETSSFTHLSAEEALGPTEEEFDPYQYRPLHVRVQVTLHDIQAHLVKNCDEEGLPSPCIYLERLGFEMDKQYEETRLQVSISPAILVAKDNVERPPSHAHLREGHLALSGLQVRGHAMFSHEGLPLDSETLEYAWMVEATVGDITGRLTAPQLQNIVEALQTFVFLVEDSENNLQRPCSYHICQHGLPQPDCTADPTLSFPCPTTENIKYRMTRASIDCIDLYLVETGAALNLQVYPVRVATCNLHGKNNKAGVTALIPNLNIKQLLLSSPVDQDYAGPSDLWLEAGGISLGPLNVDAAMALPSPEFHAVQDTFLKLHDKKTHRLWFLWPPDLSVMSPRVVGKCGCVGGCKFFGNNRNGPRFFQPDDHDFVDGVNTAVFMICTEGPELGYGQSLLQKGQLIFDIQGTSLPVTPSKSKLLDKGRMAAANSKMSVDTPRTSTTLIDDSSLRQSTLLAYISDHSSTHGLEDISSSEQTLKGSETNGSSASHRESESTSGHSRHSTGGMSIPSELLPDSPMPDPYDTDHYGSTPSDTAVTWLSGGSITSLPDVVTNQPGWSKRHERKHSYDATKVAANTLPRKSSNGSSSAPTASSPSSSLASAAVAVMANSQRKDSLGSLPSYSSGQSVSRQSSLTSPVLRRLSSQFSIQNDGSQASMTGSERFFSAPEDVNELATSSSEVEAAYPLINGRTRQVTSTSSTSEYKSFSDVSVGSPGPVDPALSQTVIHSNVRHTKPLHRQDSTSSDTGSLASFVSAVSSQVGSLHDVHRVSSQLDISRDQIETEVEAEKGETEQEGGENITTPTGSHNYVDLHGQINQQITKSPLLMSCYINHLTQLHCSHWSSPPPLPHLVMKQQGASAQQPHDASSSFHSKISSPGVSDHAPTPAWIPHFAYKQQGFGPRLMATKREPQTPPSLNSPSGINDKHKTATFNDPLGSVADSDLGFTYDDHVSKTTAVVNLKGSVDIMVSPLLLESLQRYVEAVTPLLASLHPSTIVDGLHLQCSNAVKAQNKLKKQSGDKEALDRRDAECGAGGGGGGGAEEGRPRSDSDPATDGQDSKTSRLQVMFSLSKMNISILQVSLVEEVISIAALDYVRDLTCVSVLAVCVDNITCQLLTNNHSHKSVEVGSDASPDSVAAKNPPNQKATLARAGAAVVDAAASITARSTVSGEKKKTDLGSVEVETDHGLEMQREEMVGNLHISRIHFQLRRMKKNSNFSDRVILTAIPEYRSKVLFTFHRPYNPLSPHWHSTPAHAVDSPAATSTLGPEPTAEDLAGFIMFECGLGDINLRAAKRSGFQGGLGPQEEENLTHIDSVLHSIHEKTGFPGPSTSSSGQHQVEQQQSAQRASTEGGARPKSSTSLNANNHNGDTMRESDTGSVNGSNASGLGNSADDEDSSWHSRVSYASDVETGAMGEEDREHQTDPTEGSGEGIGSVDGGELQGDASSCVLELKSAWFNFAAPPPSPRKRKLEYTRLDWNLLSTFTPAINAWMNPGHRAMVSCKHLVAELKCRVSTVMACIMTEALDYQRLHLPARSKHNKITSLSKTLQDDPSCQLLAVLQKYIRKVGLKVIDENINVDTIPQLITIQKGLLALTRQWKNVLYMPVVDTSFKSRRKVPPYTVTFAIPKDDSLDNFTSLGIDEPEITGSLDNFEVVDEKTSLLKAEGGSIGHAGSLLSLSGSGPGGGGGGGGGAAGGPSRPAGGASGGGGLSTAGRPLTHHASAGQLDTAGLETLDVQAKTSSVESVPVGDRHTPVHLSKTRSKSGGGAGVATPYSSIDSPAKLTLGSQSGPGGSSSHLAGMTGQQQQQQQQQSLQGQPPPQQLGAPQAPPRIRRNESNMSFVSGSVSMSSVDVPGPSAPGTPLKTSLTRQLSELEKREDEDLYRWMQRQQEYTRLCNHPNLHYYPSVGHESFTNAGLSEYSQDDSISMQQVAMAHSLLQLADAQVLFKPLLAAIGIHLGAVKTSAFMKKFGGNVSIQGKLHTLRIDIVDSETSTARKNKGKALKAKLKKLPKLHIHTGLDTPAFLCDTFAVVICMKDMVDFEKDKEDGHSASGLDWRRRSLRAIKFAMDHMEAKPTTTKVHFSINCNAINQHVNMSLLRLVHQFVTMIENINETRVELSGHKADYQTHRKQDSKGSSTGTESAEQAEGLKGEGTSPLLDMETPEVIAKSSGQPQKHGGQERPDGSSKHPARPEAPPRPDAPPSHKPAPPPRPDPPAPGRTGPKAALDGRPPDRLAMGLPSLGGKSPKKFSFKRGKTEFFGSKSTSTAVPTEPTTKHGNKVGSPPLHDLNLSDSAVIEMADTSSPALAEKTIVDEIKATTPKCWRTLYHLLDLYSTMPETKTLGRRTTSASRLSVIDEEPEKLSQTHSLSRHAHHHVGPRHGSSGAGGAGGKVTRTGTGSAPSSAAMGGASNSGNGSSTNNVDSIERQPMDSASPTGAAAATSGHFNNRAAYTGNTFTQSIFISESIPLVVFGIAKVKRIRISAMLSGLKLEADLQNVHTSATHRQRVKGVLKRKSQESSATAYVGHTMIVLLEGVPPSMQTVVTVNIAKSQGLYSSVTKRSRAHNSSLVTIGKIDVDIPQHPVVLHGMVARSSRRLSSTLQEFMRVPAKVSRSFDSMDGSMPSQQPSKHSELSDYMTTGPAGPGSLDRPGAKTETSPAPMVIHFKAVLQGLVIGASLLPSLKAQYKMGEVSSSGVTGKKARFTVDLPTHSLSFSSKVNSNLEPCSDESPLPSRGPTPHVVMRKKPGRRSQRDPVSTPITLPSSASVDLPPIHIHADYRTHSADTLSTDGGLTEGLVLREGNYLNAVAEVGAFEHSLTTDLLNHLVFVQKVFMKEVNEVVQKVSGTDQPVPLWTEEGFSVGKEPSKPLLYSLHFTLKGIQITATTPTSNAVRLETGCIELELSNRVQTASKDGTTVRNSTPKVFVKAQVDLNLALGTLLRNPMFEEAEPEFQHLASFATRIGLRNALQDEMIPEVSKDQEALLITLKRPVVFVQPAAFDKAVLVWLNYKNAYEYWNEQRLALNKEVQTATQQVIDKLPLGTTSATPALGTLFLQLTVEDLGICLPMTAQGLGAGGKMIDEPGAAMVLTLESTQISACSCGSLVSKGRFTGFSLRFADDFEVSWDDWKPDKSLDLVMNAMVVPEGTYEVCSRTSAAAEPGSNPSWLLNVMWRMCGIDVHLDTNIGKRLSALGNTLTSLAGEQAAAQDEFDDVVMGGAGGSGPGSGAGSMTGSVFGGRAGAGSGGVESERELAALAAARRPTEPMGRRGNSALLAGETLLPAFVYDTRLDAKTRARLIEQEMNEQAKVVQDLKQLGATHATIDIEARKLAELEAAVFNDFRQDIMKRIKRQSVKATALKDKLGLGYKPAHLRSKSTGAAPAAPPVAVAAGGGHQHPRRRNSKPDPHGPAQQPPPPPRRLTSYREDMSLDHQPPLPPPPQQQQQNAVSIANTASAGANRLGKSHKRAMSIDIDATSSQRSAFDKVPSSPTDMFSTTVDDPTHFQFEDTSPSSPGSGGGPPYQRLSLQDILASSSEDSDDNSLDQDLFYLNKTSRRINFDETVESRAAKVPSPSVGSSGSQKTGYSLEPSVDFQLDIKVEISSGQCVLHPKDKVIIKIDQLEAEPKTRGKKDLKPETSPNLHRRRKKQSMDAGRYHSKMSSQQSAVDNTTMFFLPGLDVKVHYNSKTQPVSATSESPTASSSGAKPDFSAVFNAPAGPKITTTPATPQPTPTTTPLGTPKVTPTTNVNDGFVPDTTSVGSLAGKKPGKKANLYAWLYLQQLSEEMLITPVLLDFLEQALEPIPMVQLTQTKSKAATTFNAAIGDDLDTSATSLVASSTAAYSSFPVEVVVYIRVQPSLVRFSCLPVSRVECLLRLPSLDLVFSTKRADVECNQMADTSPPTKAKSGGMKRSNSIGGRPTASSGAAGGGASAGSRSSPVGGTGAGSGAGTGSAAAGIESLAGGGLSVTGCLADFSLYIFHPYGGGGQKKSLSVLESSFRHRSLNAGHDGTQSPLADTIGRKDSLSLNVEFVKVNISRSRRGVLQHSEATLTTSQSSSKLSSLLADAQSRAANVVRFSAVCDIGSASFKYDMRRLSEILALPKAWYRRSLARRVFLGEESATVISDSEEDASSSPPTPESPLFAPFGRAQTISSIHTSHLDSTTGEKAHRRVASEDRNVPINLDFKRELDNINQSRTPSGVSSPVDEGNFSRSPTSPGQCRPPLLSSSPPTASDLRDRLKGYARLRDQGRLPDGRGVSSREMRGKAPGASARGAARGAAPGRFGSGAATASGATGQSSSGSGSGSLFHPPVAPGKSIKEWETLVLFAVNLARLDVMVNMSNVMGQSVWATTDLKSQGRLSIDSSGYKNMKITGGLGGSKLEAQGGIVGGKIQLHNLSSYVSISEDPGHEPDHRAGLTLYTLETRLDYMGSSMLMGRISKLGITLSDEWRLDMDSADTQPLATKRPAIVFVHGDTSWDKLHLMISRSTTPDLVKMAAKLEEFFYQQFHSSKRVLSAFGPMPGTIRKSRSSKNSGDEASWISEIRHHRHWQKVLEHVSGCKLSMFTFKLPTQGTILGGTVSLHGNNLSLACFHGINFRSKSWALFTMDEPYIGFATEAQDIVDDEGAKCTHIVENLSFQLGHNFSERNRDQHMATICKLSRSHYMPPPFTSVQEWFHYAFASSEIKNLDNFPPAPRAGSESPQERRSSSRKSQDYNHETEVIFALPSLQMHLKTEHLQGEDPPTEDDPKPVVECSFVTEFEDHIFVAMDAEAILFLHDLVTNYVKEKDRGTKTASYHKRSPDSEKKPLSDPTAVLKQDFREFECKTWHLEPTVRFISWAGKRIDPMGVDYILQKLGFQHARLTIPKWMQRGAMDPLDKILSLLVHRLISVLQEASPDDDSDP